MRMMLANDELRTVLVSIHVSLRAALAAVTFENVLQTIQITHEALSRMLGRRPVSLSRASIPMPGKVGCLVRKRSIPLPRHCGCLCARL